MKSPLRLKKQILDLDRKATISLDSFTKDMRELNNFFNTFKDVSINFETYLKNKYKLTDEEAKVASNVITERKTIRQ